MEQLKIVVKKVSEIASSVDSLRGIDAVKLKEEVLNLDFAAKNEICEVFRESFNLQNDSLEETIEKGFDLITMILIFVGKVIPKA